MINPAILKIRERLYHSPKSKSKQFIAQPSLTTDEAGFTLIEVIVVVLMIAILSAIAAPSWLGFVNNQRVSKVNDALLSTIQEAQRNAKSKKLSYSVSFRMNGDIPEFAIHPSDTTNPTGWRPLLAGSGVEVKPDQIWVGSNLDDTDANKVDGNVVRLDTGKKTITFDQFGNLPKEPTPDLGANDVGLVIAVAVPKPDQPTEPLPATIRCVKVKTLLGSIQTTKGQSDCSL